MRVNIGPYEDEQKVSIEYDAYDTWNLDHTLALIILPGLKQLKSHVQGYPVIDQEDVPHIAGNYSSGMKAWYWILDEMIYAFEEVVKDEYFSVEDTERVNNGLRLFGKYFRNLWD